MCLLLVDSMMIGFDMILYSLLSLRTCFVNDDRLCFAIVLLLITGAVLLSVVIAPLQTSCVGYLPSLLFRRASLRRAA